MVKMRKHPEKKSAGREERVSRTLASFRQIVSAAKSQLSKVKHQFDLSGAQLWALSQVQKKSGGTVQELATAMSVHQSTASNLVEALSNGGYLQKVREDKDRRYIRLFLTTKGSAALKKAPSSPDGVLPEAMGELSEDELQALESALKSLSSKIRLLEQKAVKTPFLPFPNKR